MCEQYRDAISALVDGEEPGLDARLVDAHVARCDDCARFRATSESARRRGRVGAAQPGRDMSRRVASLAAAADRSASRRGIRLLLVVVAVEILLLSVVDLVGTDGDPDTIHGVRHLGAFTIAYGVLLLVVAVRPARARTALPVATVLAGALAITAVVDLTSGNVPLLGEALHVPEIVSVALIWMLAPAGPLERGLRRRSLPTGLGIVTPGRDAR